MKYVLVLIYIYIGTGVETTKLGGFNSGEACATEGKHVLSEFNSTRSASEYMKAYCIKVK